ncbi:tRNA (adenosine(37)-N6)-threonylcarbamoyltransferase complex dimerization subunit type 1 TsaB [Salipiger sp.]|uniref:tRNA (adenosine(37)-N6)-threonylcarbamoyltransferase complex dimerization subunit type 1 TsaB n=1 Tax=Salipiger sp. TaxID=2078585 RepID=UPI003A986137
MADLTILAFDTSAAHCAAALLRGREVLAVRAEEMGRGQAERLVPLLEEILAEAGLGWGDLDRIGVGVGPGNFTGIRISVATARGLALGLGVPAVGVDTFAVIHRDAPGALAAVPAPRGRAYLKTPGGAPRLDEAEAAQSPVWPPEADALAVGIARIAAEAVPGARPAPLYVRPADAAPSRDAPPVILS